MGFGLRGVSRERRTKREGDRKRKKRYRCIFFSDTPSGTTGFGQVCESCEAIENSPNYNYRTWLFYYNYLMIYHDSPRAWDSIVNFHFFFSRGWRSKLQVCDIANLSLHAASLRSWMSWHWETGSTSCIIMRCGALARCASTERPSCSELGSRRIFKSGISSGSSDPEIGAPLGALGSGQSHSRRSRLVAVGRAETRGERKEDGAWRGDWERERERFHHTQYACS